jgi:hypothetical protein
MKSGQGNPTEIMKEMELVMGTFADEMPPAQKENMKKLRVMLQTLQSLHNMAVR